MIVEWRIKINVNESIAIVIVCRVETSAGMECDLAHGCNQCVLLAVDTCSCDLRCLYKFQYSELIHTHSTYALKHVHVCMH